MIQDIRALYIRLMNFAVISTLKCNQRGRDLEKRNKIEGGSSL